MKTTILIILSCATLLGFGLYLHEINKSAEIRVAITESQNQVAAAQAQVTDLQNQLAEKEQRVTELQGKLKETRQKVVAKVDEAAQLQTELTNKVQAASKKSNPFAAMFKSDEMKGFIKEQQKTVLGTLIDKNYATFFTNMNLSPEQSASLKDLITKKSLLDAQAGLSMLSGETDADQRAELTKKTKADKDAIDWEIKDFLGDDGFKEFQAYEKTMPERMAIGTFRDQQASGPNKLTPDQEAQLVQAMAEERQNFKFTTDMYDQAKVANDPSSYFTEDKVNQFIAEQQELNAQYLSRAKDILSAEQLTPFEKFLKSQTDMQKLGMKKAEQMFSNGGTSSSAKLNRP